MKYQSSQSRGLLPVIVIEYVYLKATQKVRLNAFKKRLAHRKQKVISMIMLTYNKSSGILSI